MKIQVRQIPDSKYPFLHVCNFGNKTMQYFSSMQSKKYLFNSIGVWKPKTLITLLL